MIKSIDIGQQVAVGLNVGTIIAVEYVQAHPSGVVPLHEILFTHKIIRNANKSKLVTIKNYTRKVNYAFIRVISGVENGFK